MPSIGCACKECTDKKESNAHDHPKIEDSNLVGDTLVLTGLDCADCAAKLEKAVSRMEGIARVAINFATSKMKVEYNPVQINRGNIAAKIKDLGYGVASDRANDNNKKVFDLSGLDCADCAAKLEAKVSRLEGVQEARVNFGAAKMTVTGDVLADLILKTVKEAGYDAVLAGTETPTKDIPFWVKNRKVVTTALSGLALLAGTLLSWVGVSETVVIACYTLAMIIGGYYPAKAGYYSLRGGFSFDMNVLMTVAAVGAAALGQWAEGATVIFLFSLGNALESYTMEKTRQSIRGLMDLAPKQALVRRNGEEIKLPVQEIKVGDTVIIKPGERIPIDGKVIKGLSAVNQAAITGESIPVEKNIGDEVFAGTINEKGYLEIQVTRLVDDTTLAKIIKLVEEAQAQKAPSQRFVDVFAKYYTPAVILIAAGIAVVPPFALGQPFAPWIYRALTLLVVSCPCALVISTPVSIVSAIGNAARNGVLIKGGAYLEQAGTIKVVAFDKTGTLTKGLPEVTDVLPAEGFTEHQVLSIASAIETRSEHPLAEAVLRYAKKLDVEFHPGENFVSITGKGAKAKINGQNYYIGNTKFFAQDLGLKDEKMLHNLERLQQEGKTVMLVGNKAGMIGLIAVADSIRETSTETIRKLRTDGIKTVMLTGDNTGTALAIANTLGIDDFKAELLPEDKVTAIKDLSHEYNQVAMVGDGINDAPALATATVGIAMGGAGTDTALETADIALMADDLTKLPYAMKLSRKALGIIKQNIGFALIVKVLAVILVFPGWLNLWLAIMADTGASLIVIANGMRLLRVKPAKKII